MSSKTTSRHSRWFLPLLLIGSFAALWQILAITGGINRSLMSAPSDIAGELIALHQRDPAQSLLFGHILATLKRLVVASVLGTLIGTIIGVAMGLNRYIYRFFDPLITAIMPIPGIAIAPIFIVWLGFGDATIIAVGVIATFFPVVYNTAAGVRTVDQQLVRAALIMGASKTTTLFSVYLPWAATHLLLGIKLGLARCWRTVVAVELIAAANWGLGYMIWDAAEYLRSGVVYGGIVIMIAIYFLIETFIIRTVEKNTLIKWGMLNE